ncbi:uncharacterized protein TNIN_437281 [Trichonephila inaurata madagascariensis]|uniref:Uncharacterized protein n=1 Tax=Trichonephila inaurata madagascariensis TaxID=2747483 RepID=A0A8X6WXM3_9ARAC|nr:uncharacterized protein TNIN_437281 [Trichonephila inaurata madagascariensis]
MAYLGKGRIAELRYIAKQLGEKVTDELKIIHLKNLIVNSPNYEEEFVREMLNMIIEKRLKTSTSRVSKYFDLKERYILSTYELETLFKLKKHNSKTLDKVKSEHASVKYIHGDTMTCLQPAERKIECEPIHGVSKPVVSPGHLDREKYFLEGNTFLAVRPEECELAQEYRGHVVGLGKQSTKG